MNCVLRAMPRGALLCALLCCVDARAHAQGDGVSATRAAAPTTAERPAEGAANAPGDTGVANAPDEADATQHAEADELFRQGKAAMGAGDYAAACDRFDRSYRLDPATGALLALALCEERRGRLVTARAHYLEAAERSQAEGHTARETAARTRAEALLGKLSTLTIELATRAEDVDVRVNGRPLAPQLLGKALPVDGGIQHVAVSAPGKQSFEASLEVGPESDAVRVVVAGLEPAPAPDRPAPAPAPPIEAETYDFDDDRPLLDFSAEEWVGMGFIGAGAVGVVLGTVFAIQAATQDAPKGTGCAMGGCASFGGDPGDLATLAFVSGGLLGATGVAIFFAFQESPSATGQHAGPAVRAHALLLPGGAGARLSGSF